MKKKRRLLRDKTPRDDFSRYFVLFMFEQHSENCVMKMTMTIVISTARRNLSFAFVSTDLTTRSLTGVYAEFNEVFEMTGKGLSSRGYRSDLLSTLNELP